MSTVLESTPHKNRFDFSDQINSYAGDNSGKRSSNLKMAVGAGSSSIGTNGFNGNQKFSTTNSQNKFNHTVKMQASGVDTVAQPKVKTDSGASPLKKPPQINQDLTNKVFADMDQLNAKSKGAQDRNGTSQKNGTVQGKDSEVAEKQYNVKEQNNGMKVNKNHFDKIFSKLKNVPNPKFIKEYADLFVESRMLERIIPRDVQEPGELESFNPYLIRDVIAEKLVDEGQSPYVGSDLDGVNRVSKSSIFSIQFHT